ncbi:hypothetical protein [Faucicola boevrei]|uniref:hypothetical protein n=1 Tax=Faucicola boevrei TaxID=346665 RepID=UPI0003713866|nr:hypothetical protein [Moraxella boevrei]
MQFSFSRLAGAMLAVSSLWLVACNKAEETKTEATTALCQQAIQLLHQYLPTQMLKVSW